MEEEGGVSELPDDLAEAFEYLDRLRESETNIFDACPYLMRDMGYERREASAVLGAWMKTFGGTITPEERAAKARGES